MTAAAPADDGMPEIVPPPNSQPASKSQESAAAGPSEPAPAWRAHPLHFTFLLLLVFLIFIGIGGKQSA